MVLPILILLIVGTVEFTRLLRIKEMMSVGTSEVAKIAFRKCYDIPREECDGSSAGLGEMSKQDECVFNIGKDINPYMTRFLGMPAALSINIYRWNDTSSAVEWYATTRRSKQDPQPTRSEYFKGAIDDGSAKVTQEFVSEENGDQIIERQKFAVITEMYVPYQSLLGNFPLGGLGFFNAPGELYDITIY